MKMNIWYKLKFPVFVIIFLTGGYLFMSDYRTIWFWIGFLLLLFGLYLIKKW